jgi:hypothetical protein
MKIRSGFVSNSSSSSFIVISNNGQPEKPKYFSNVLTVNSSLGKTQFGWEDEINSYWGTKIIFCYLQTIYARESYSKYQDKADEWLLMLENVIKYWTGCESINWFLTTEYSNDNTNWAYIDHASNSGENSNIEMFENEFILGNFIFNPKSYIHTQNDNS